MNGCFWLYNLYNDKFGKCEFILINIKKWIKIRGGWGIDMDMSLILRYNVIKYLIMKEKGVVNGKWR